jgi:hypothetical protein
MQAAIKKWSNGEFSLSVLSAKDREKELNGSTMLLSHSKECL